MDIEFFPKKPNYKDFQEDNPICSFGFKVFRKPISLQASRREKEEVLSLIRESLATTDFFLIDEVSIEIEWFSHPISRFESDASPDVDNIIKPIVDTLCGPEGIMIDDCQVQHVSSCWIDVGTEENFFTVTVSFDCDSIVEKEKLFFLKVKNALCLPFLKNLEKTFEKEFFTFYESMIQTMLKVREEVGYFQAQYFKCLLARRFFHISRIKGFEVVNIEDYKASLNLETNQN